MENDIKLHRGTIIQYGKMKYEIYGIITTNDQFGQGTYMYRVRDIRTCEPKAILYRTEFNIIKEPDTKTLIVSAYPCTGKTTAFLENMSNTTYMDIDYKRFRWLIDSDGNKTDKINTNFTSHYMKEIQDNIGKVDIIFVSHHETIRNKLANADIPFITIYPKRTLLNEYVGRMYRRGDSKQDIDKFISNWNNDMSCIDSEMCGFELIQLESNQYISGYML